jgi:hypothetical protein
MASLQQESQQQESQQQERPQESQQQEQQQESQQQERPQESQQQEQPEVKEDTDKYTKIDHLDEDEPINGQKWALLSFISPEGVMNCSVRGVKVRGVYATEEAARNAAAKFKHTDKYFDVFVGEVGKWLPWDPNPMDVSEAVYNKKKQTHIMQGMHKRNEETMNELVGRRKEMLDKSKETHKQRVAQSIKDSAKDQHVNETKSKNHSAQDMRERLQKLHQEKEKNKLNSASASVTATATATQTATPTPSSSNNLTQSAQDDPADAIVKKAQALGKIMEPLDQPSENLEDKAALLNENIEKLKNLYNKMQNKKQ